MSDDQLALEWIPGRYVVCRLAAETDLPDWARTPARGAPLLAVTRTDRELSIVVEEGVVPAEVESERGWVALRIAEQLDFSIIGVLAVLTTALTAARITVFVISTYETDVLLVKSVDATRAVEALAKVANVSRL